MNCCTQLDDILHEHVHWQPNEPCPVSQSKSRSFFLWWTKVHQIVFIEHGKIVVDNAIFRMSIAWSVPEIFAIKVSSCSKSSALFITHEPLHSAWWNFTHTGTSTTSITPLNFKVIGQRSRSHELFCCFRCAWCCGYPRTVLSLEQGLMILLVLSAAQQQANTGSLSLVPAATSS